MALDRLLAFSLLAYALIVVPGPSVLFVIGRALSVGRRAALATVAGNAAGEFLQSAGVAVGLGLVLARSALLFDALKLAGAVYLAYLGLEAIRNRRSLSVPLDRSAPLSDGTAFRAGFMVGLTNPKTTVFFAAVLPQFVTTTAGAVPVPLQLLLLGLVFVAIALLSDSIWAMAASGARAWFARSPRLSETLGAAGGVVMIGLAARLALSSRTD